MLTYQIRPRVLRLEGAEELRFPADGKVNFIFGPLQPFGIEASGGRTAIRAAAASVLFNANTGAHSIKSNPPLHPLEVAIEEPTRRLVLRGNTLTIDQQFDSNAQLTALIEGVYYGFPTLLNVEWADPPVVERVDGIIEGISFRWELAAWNCQFKTTSQENQEQRFADSWEKMNLISEPTSARLFAALHFYYVAVRLRCRGTLAGEFLSEVILNLAKVLEVLFPASGDGKSREAARLGLRELGFNEEDIEGDYIPAMALRNEIDVGHVDLGLFKPDHLKLIHGYTERAEYAFRQLLQRVLTRVAEGTYEIAPYTRGPVRHSAVRVVERMQKYAHKYAL